MAVREKSEDVEIGILIALGVIYQCGAETVAEELVKACDEKALLRIAKREGDPYLKNLRQTVRFLYGR